MKKMIAFAAFVLSVAVISPAQAKVFESKKMEDALSHVTPDTLLILDVDNTLIESAQMLGGDRWYYYSVDKFKKAGLSEKEATDKAMKTWFDLQKVTKVTAVEPKTPELVTVLQDKGVKVMLLTARSIEEAPTLYDQLSSVGIDIAKSPPSTKQYFFASSRYYKGMLLVNVNNKGDVLKLFLAKAKVKPAKAVFIDDKKKNVESVDQALASMGIECDCIRYGFLDEKVKKFDPAIADVEYEFFGKILDDASARAILTKRHAR